MADRKLTPELAAELAKLALMPDHEIDTSDIPEVLDWSQAKRGVFSPEKIQRRAYDVRGLANWFLEQGQRAGHAYSNMSLNKLVYLAVERALVERSILLTPARIEAWQHGPVFREVFQAFKSSGNAPVTRFADRFSVTEKKMVEARESFRAEDEEFLHRVFKRYGHRTTAQLRAISHRQGGPWHVVWHYLGSLNPGMEITPAIIFENAPQLRDLDDQS
jgi:uncharacterized phage-associated protein